jgi:hypothetical protein
VTAISALLCAGCANATLTPTLGSGNALTGGASAVSVASPASASEVPRKTVASKVLAAIALERVTGRKPDPARLKELD